MHHLLQPDPQPLVDWLAQHGQPPYRADQIRKCLFARRAGSLEEMTDLPTSLWSALAEDFRIWTTRIVAHRRADDGTEKLLLELADGGQIECVLLRDGPRRTICLSTQVGCAMGCVFCASGLDGVERNLTAGEIVEQMLQLQRLLEQDERLSHIVMMGMGEPLANLDQLLPALELASSPTGLAISARRITISTVGLPKAIHRLADGQCRYHLAVSLHAADDTLRSSLVPVNKSAGLDKILEAADRYFDVSGRRLTFEYVLLAGVNDHDAHAHDLVKLLRGRAALVNLIPFNPVKGLPYRTPSGRSTAQFRLILESGGLTVKTRQRKGERINAACGQLRRALSSEEVTFPG